MKVAFDDSEVLISGERETQDFRFKASGHAFKIMSDTLYSDKVRAIIRELSTNAWDSHKDAGKEDVKFDVHFPTIFDPYFYVRDYGTGLSHSDVMNLYTTFFESTKTNSNDFVGALGLGSKSPFGYTDQIVVDSWFDGNHRSYSTFIGDAGIPKCVLLSTKKCDPDETGIKVTIPVEEKDCHSGGVFFQKALLVFPVFEVLPNLLNLEKNYLEQIEEDHRLFWEECPKLGESEYTKNTLNFHKISAFPWYVRQGNVIYPVSVNDIKINDDNAEKEKDTKQLVEWFSKYLFSVLGTNRYSSSHACLISNVEIGQVSVAPSREALSYDDVTSSFIMSQISKVTQAMVDSYTESYRAYENPDDLFAAVSELKRKVVVVPEWLETRVAESPYKADGLDKWLMLSLTNKFPQFSKNYQGTIVETVSEVLCNTIPDSLRQDVLIKPKDHVIEAMVSGGVEPRVIEKTSKGTSTPILFNLHEVSSKESYNSKDSYPTYNGYGSSVSSIMSLRTRLSNEKKNYPSNKKEIVTVILVDDFKTISAGNKIAKLIRDYSDDLILCGEIFVYRPANSSIRGYKDNLKMVGTTGSSYIEQDIDADKVYQYFKDTVVPVMEWITGGKAVIYSDIIEGLEKKRRDEMKKAKAASNQNTFPVKCLGVGKSAWSTGVEDILEYARKHQNIFVVYTKGSMYHFIDGVKESIAYSSGTEIIERFRRAFNFKDKVFFLNQVDTKSVKKAGLADRLINFYDWMSVTFSTFSERHPLAYAMARIGPSKQPVSHRIVQRAASLISDDFFVKNFEELFGHSGLRLKNSSVIDTFIKKASVFRLVPEEMSPLGKPSATSVRNASSLITKDTLADEVGEAAANLDMLKKVKDKIRFFVNHRYELLSLNSVTKSNRFMPRSKIASDIKDSANKVIQLVKGEPSQMGGFLHKVYERYPLLNGVVVSAIPEDLVLDHMKFYISAVDKAAECVQNTQTLNKGDENVTL